MNNFKKGNYLYDDLGYVFIYSGIETNSGYGAFAGQFDTYMIKFKNINRLWAPKRNIRFATKEEINKFNYILKNNYHKIWDSKKMKFKNIK